MTTALRAFALWVLLMAGAARAQDAVDETTGDRAQAFEAVEGAVKEDVPGGPLLVAAYGLIWLVVFGYLVRLVRLQARTEAEVARLNQALAGGDRDAPKG